MLRTKALTGAIKNEDPTMTEEMAHIELMHRFAQVQGQVPPAMLWYEHWGYKENWNNRDYNDPSMQRPFDDFIKEALAKDSGVPYFASASLSASTQKSVVSVLEVRQASTLRLAQSMIATR